MGLKQRWTDAVAANPRDASTRPIGWGQALAVMGVLAAVLWVVEIVDLVDGYGLNRYGLRPRILDGLYGVLTMPFLHANLLHLLANTGPFVLIGWVVMLTGWRVFTAVSLLVIALGGLLTWSIGPSHTTIVGVSGLVFGWMGYIVARAFFSRRWAWIASAIVVLLLFGSMFGSLLPQIGHGSTSTVSWQAHLSGLVAGLVAGWLFHPHKAKAATLRFRTPAS